MTVIEREDKLDKEMDRVLVLKRYLTLQLKIQDQRLAALKEYEEWENATLAMEDYRSKFLTVQP